jgi:hypothetical protein
MKSVFTNIDRTAVPGWAFSSSAGLGKSIPFSRWNELSATSSSFCRKAFTISQAKYSGFAVALVMYPACAWTGVIVESLTSDNSPTGVGDLQRDLSSRAAVHDKNHLSPFVRSFVGEPSQNIFAETKTELTWTWYT